MKKVEAIIRKSKFKDVTKSLQEVGVNFFSYWDVTGLGIDKEDNDVSSMVIKETNNIKRCYGKRSLPSRDRVKHLKSLTFL